MSLCPRVPLCVGGSGSLDHPREEPPFRIATCRWPCRWSSDARRGPGTGVTSRAVGSVLLGFGSTASIRPPKGSLLCSSRGRKLKGCVGRVRRLAGLDRCGNHGFEREHSGGARKRSSSRLNQTIAHRDRPPARRAFRKGHGREHRSGDVGSPGGGGQGARLCGLTPPALWPREAQTCMWANSAVRIREVPHSRAKGHWPRFGLSSGGRWAPAYLSAQDTFWKTQEPVPWWPSTME